ncbi:mechanosensitive ion channel domain-containing protein [Gordonibacter massiliensis (ex Traore et al. 2017)]|uniref:Mechanosensitive ion channel n=1 Tax=Gordonibacter massiliensis (ex Traore et al. 2017) TaxID=1841863 RepID=A0A842JJ76_9ACTN|nr:mechanosensitive ion channel domain-containing protein [Gordonibacter massiliensis (ex Traore et al. 2017)]MBC2889795.1 mechanosensitive ion channel [Gordonibacter massiliensis (ex Traore et al. 2017)]
MSRKLKVKIAVLIVVAAVSMAAMGVLLATMQTDLSLDGYTQEMQQEAAALPDLLVDADDGVKQNTATYDAIFQSKAESVAYMANNNTGFEATPAKMAEYQDLLGVDNVMVVDREGNLIAQARETLANFTYARFNQLRTVFDDGKPSKAVEIELPDQDWLMRYYAARIDDSTMVVIEQNPAELRELTQIAGSTESVLKNIAIGQHGYLFAVSAKDYLVEYHPNSNLVGADAIDKGIDATDLEDGAFSWMTLDGESLYCHVSKIGDTYYIGAVPESDMAATRNITVGVILFIFFAVMCVVIMYGVFVMREDERQGHDSENYREIGPLRYSKVIGRKAAVLSLVGFLGILLVSFYMQTLFALSSQSVANNERAAEMVETIQRANDRMDDLSDQYGERYLSKCRVAGYILDRNPALANSDDLKKLGDVLQIQYLYVYDETGFMTATSSSYTNFILSENPDDQSFEFRKLLQGADAVVQEPRADDITGELRQYIGVSLHDAKGNASGLVQISVRPTRLENLLSTVRIDSVLDGVKAGSDGFAFAVSKADGAFAYFPDQRLVGKDALEHGMTENQLKDGYCDYVTIDGVQYYASSAETDDYYLYIAGAEGELMAERVPLTLATGGVALVCLAVIFLLLAFEPRRSITVAKAPVDADARMFDVKMPSGRMAKTESAASRWLDRSFKWNERTAEQKTAAVVKWLVGISVVVVFVAVVFQDRFFGSNSIFSYILGGEWERGLNVFALTACLMFVCVALTVVAVVQKLLNLLATVLGARGETVCRLLGSFIKYATIIGMVYYCLMLVGVDTTTLLASAGILSIAISFGAKELVSDILSGLFIIFEGEFRVGDIIKVGDWRGTVVEIGVRTTKVEDGSQNIKVIRNSDISNVINMTKETSYASCDVGIEYGESLERVENILAQELPFVRKRLPAIIDGPFYKGVVSLGDNSVNIRIVVQCAETDRLQLERDLNREMKLIFDKHDIGIPFPQVVINQPTEFKKATEWEKRSADQFNEEQKAAAKELGNEEEDQTR